MSDKRISRVARGKRPVYFSDPAIDKLMSMLLAVVAELSVTRDRLDAVERLLHERGVLARGDVDAFEPDDAVRTERETSRAAFIERVMRVVSMELQRTDSSGATESFTSTLREMLEGDDSPGAS
jgi:hypothetical protein